MAEQISGVYLIRNKITNGKYVGSSVDIGRRWRSHLFALQKARHENKYLQRSCDKYGLVNFEFVVLEETEPTLEALIQAEQRQLDLLLPEYNILPRAYSGLGRVFDEVARANMSKAQRGHPTSDEARRNLSLSHRGLVAWNKGRLCSEEKREKQSLAMKGKVP